MDKKTQGDIEDGSRKFSELSSMYLVIGFVAAVVIGSMGYILYTGNHMAAVHGPFMDAAMEIKIEVTTAHLWFEEIISGDRHESIDSVWEHLDKADWYADAMLHGGKGEHGEFIPLKGEVTGRIEKLQVKLAEFRAITQQRFAQPGDSLAGSEIDHRYDAVFGELNEITENVEAEIKQVIKGELRNFRVLQKVLIFICLSISVVVGIIFNRFILKQNEDKLKLQAANQQLNASNQQLNASNQQLDASNQQLRASEQQLRAANQQLRASEAELAKEHSLLRTLIDNLPDAIYFKDAESRFIMANATTAHWMGAKSYEELIGKGDADFFPPKLAKSFHADEKKIIRSGRAIINHEERIVNQTTGEKIWSLTTKVPLLDGEGKVIEIVGISRNITERKQAEEQLRAVNQQLVASGQQLRAANQQLDASNQQLDAGNQQLRASEQQLKAANQQLQVSEKNYRLLFNEMTGGFALHEIICDEDGKPCDYRFLHVNPAFEKLTGLSAKDIIGKTVLEVLPDIESYWMETYGEVAITGESVHFENYSHELNRHYDIVAYCPEKGKFAALFHDITQRKQAEVALQESEEKFKSISKYAKDAIIMLGPKGEVSFWNPAAEKMFGYKTEEILGKNLHTLLTPPRYHDAHRRAFPHFQKTGQGDVMGKTLEISALRKDGTEFPVELSVSPLRLKDEWHAVGIIRDISERKQAEEALQKAHGELEKRVEERTVELVESQKRLRSLASQLSTTEEQTRKHIAEAIHDDAIQTLIFLKMKFDDLRGLKPSNQFSKVLGRIENQTDDLIQRMRTLTFDLSSPILYDLGLSAAIKDWLVREIEGHYNIKTRFEDDGRTKDLDEDLRVVLYRSVRELLANVVKHAQAKNVTVSRKKLRNKIIITVEDDGKSFTIPKDGLKYDTSGGFGLFTISERLSQYNGSLKIGHGKTGGTRVVLTAPLREQENSNMGG